MKATKIDWCDCTVNPVVGCKNGCKYCYARKINDRFHFIDNWEEPQFFPERLEQLNSKKTKSIFMDSMSDIGWWKKEWINETMKAIKENPQHNYIFLTKGTEILHQFYLKTNIYDFNRIFFGRSVTTQTDMDLTEVELFDFLSIEPILSPISIKDFGNIMQVIIGAETGNRKGKVIPEKEWIDNIVKQCDEANVRVFMKSSLKEIMGKDFIQDKLLWEGL